MSGEILQADPAHGPKVVRAILRGRPEGSRVEGPFSTRRRVCLHEAGSFPSTWRTTSKVNRASLGASADVMSGITLSSESRERRGRERSQTGTHGAAQSGRDRGRERTGRLRSGRGTRLAGCRD